MREQDFTLQLNRLSNTFGKSVYSTERAALIWKAVKDEDAGWFSRTVDEFIGSHRQPPLLDDFRSEISKERERHSSKVIRPDVPAWNGRSGCWCCKDTGCFVCIHPVKPGFWAFRCACDRGLKDPRQFIPLFTHEHASEGFRFFDAERRV